jgi:hypothetical protein
LFNDGVAPFFNFTRFGLTGLPSNPRPAHAPKLSDEQADALDTLQYFADANKVLIRQCKGDILLLNNRAALHARAKIMDKPGDGKRHLMRLCLRDSEYGHIIPEGLQRRWGEIYDLPERQNGKWTLTKMHDRSFISNKIFNESFANEETTNSHG